MANVNGKGRAYARSLIASGAIDTSSAWSFSAADGNKLLGKGGDDWAAYGKVHLATNPGEDPESKAFYSYPFAKESGGRVKIYAAAVRAIRSRASQQNERSVFGTAGRLLEKIDAKSGKGKGKEKGKEEKAGSDEEEELEGVAASSEGGRERGNRRPFRVGRPIAAARRKGEEDLTGDDSEDEESEDEQSGEEQDEEPTAGDGKKKKKDKAKASLPDQGPGGDEKAAGRESVGTEEDDKTAEEIEKEQEEGPCPGTKGRRARAEGEGDEKKPTKPKDDDNSEDDEEDEDEEEEEDDETTAHGGRGGACKSEPEPMDILAESTFDLEAVAEEGKAKKAHLARFSMVANTGNPMRLNGWRYPVVVDFAGLVIPSQSRPVRVHHDPLRGVGHTTTIRVKDGRIEASGIVSRDTTDAREVVASAKNGFPWQCSLGASADEVEFVAEGQVGQVNGKSFGGPLNIARKSTVGEISFVDLGADERTSVRVAAMAKDGKNGVQLDVEPIDGEEATRQILERARRERQRKDGISALVKEAVEFRGAPLAVISKIADQAIEDGTSVKDTELLLLRATRPRAPQHVRLADDIPGPKVLECALCMAAGIPDEKLSKDRDYGPDVTNQAWPFRNRGLRGTIAAALEASGLRVPHGHRELFDSLLEQQRIRAEGFSTINLPGILGNVANKILLNAFLMIEATYDLIADQADFSNFHTHSIYRLDAMGEFQLVGGDGELKHGGLAQDYFTNKLDTRGMILTLTRQDIINDDLNAFKTLTAQLARKARIAAERALYGRVMEPTDVFYTTAKGNLLTGALGITELAAAEAALLMMADASGDPIYATPWFMLVPPALKALADQIYSSDRVLPFITDRTMPTENPFRGRFKPVTSPFLQSAALGGSSASTWYLLANPLMLPAYQIAYLDGRRAPTVETADAIFNMLGLQMRCFWDFGVAQVDGRGAIKNKAP